MTMTLIKNEFRVCVRDDQFNVKTFIFKTKEKAQKFIEKAMDKGLIVACFG